VNQSSGYKARTPKTPLGLAWAVKNSVLTCCFGIALEKQFYSSVSSEQRQFFDSESQQLVERIVEQVEPMCEASSGYAKLPGSSEVLESLIGKGKRLLGSSNNSNSLTRQVLAMVTSTAEITPELVRTALSTCGIKHLSEWCRDYLRPGVHRDRREDLQPTEEDKNLRNPHLTATPAF